ncbi:MAG: MBOAT family protein [Clostridiales Family XIII bacterium]|jgi:alginate O-acetyltransferase complex protein AlgI|nr:MBOAT family protein [Clostridiales Family XIII bacterium]
MLFSSVSFLYYFFPIVLLAYFLVPVRNGSVRARNFVLLGASIVFYMWGEPVYVLLMLGQAVSGWFFGLLIERGRGRGDKRLMKLALFGAVAVGVGCLGFFKYSDFFIANANALFGASAGLLRLALPIGISFYTFQILSYDIDLYSGAAKVQKNLPAFATYVTLFPQLIAGPIVRYVHVEEALGSRKHTPEDFRLGARRFVFGLAKKVLIANTLGELVAVYKASEAGGESSALFVWLYAAAYALHIYFDFSGYSDMAIGIGRIFGFRFLENFNYPYIAASVTDFWRRWHISMSSWFRDYVYIRLGGNRVRPLRHLFNIVFVWLLTGFWHGAGWNFILWGLYYALLLLLEKYILSRFAFLNNNKAPARFPLSALRHFYVMLAFLVGWIFFDADTLSQGAGRLSAMFGGADAFAGPEPLYYLRSYLVPLAVAALGATPLPARAAACLAASGRGAKALSVLEPVFVLALLIVVTAYLVDGSFNPFIYFRF